MCFPRSAYRKPVILDNELVHTMSAPNEFRYYSPEFDSRTLDAWAEVKLEFSRPNKPTDNVYIESFNGRLRVECLNRHWFETFSEELEEIKS